MIPFSRRTSLRHLTINQRRPLVNLKDPIRDASTPVIAIIPLVEQSAPPPEYSSPGHIPGTFCIDLVDSSPTATTKPEDVLLPDIDMNLPELWQTKIP